MRKKTSVGKKSKVLHRKRKGTKRYLQFYVFALVAGVTAFAIGNHVIKQQTPCANTKTCQSALSEQIDNTATGTFQGRTVVPPKIDLARDTTPSVLSASASASEKHIYIDLSTQKLFAYQGETKIMESFISSGKWQATPVGNFRVWTKLRATRMAGGQGADYYNLPNVPYVMYFFQDYGIHGAYWHNNFGHAMSHGCVNMRIVDARDLFAWANVGTPVSVCKSFSGPHSCAQ